ncbi:DUF1173 family protein [Herbaspirillum lusitanum]|uniref:DUF1173 domain-containing protein n=1 Tax=Herbaspirillum lusitanum TaxID=213312 RepID=UPI0022389786|nr:DUF1173 domain-containing protein [Herbaspirillum lusitanum]MCW5300344.1 DUF1173 family protein [Herbaspirillum lusitanum]
MDNEKIYVNLPGESTPYQLKNLLHKHQSALEKAHGKQPKLRAHCDCRKFGNKAELVIRLRDQRYHVARMPNSGHMHHQDCTAFSEDPSLSGGGEYLPAISIKDDVTIIKVNFSLSKAENVEPIENNSPPNPLTGSVSRHAMGLNALLCHMWNESGLNIWIDGSIRLRSLVYSKLSEVIEGTKLGRRSLAKLIHVEPSWEKTSWLPVAPKSGATSNDYFLALFKIKSVTTHDKYSYIKSDSGEIFRVSPEVLESIQTSFKSAWSYVTRPRGSDQVPDQDKDEKPKLAQVFCLALCGWVEGADGMRIEIGKAALILTNWRYIPVDSSYELIVADKLLVEKRSFVKPLRYDAADDVVFPDFKLLDAGPNPVPMEIYGVKNNPKYDERKRAKVAHYKQSGEPFWDWTPPEPMRPFNEKK